MNTVIYEMRVNDLRAPLGIECAAPVFSWKTSAAAGWLQTAYQLTVRKGDEIVWDTGRVECGCSVGIACTAELAPCTAYTWQVKVWGSDGAETLSAAESFETGLPACKPFAGALWIAFPVRRGEHLPVFRKEINVKPGLVSARLYTSGMGVYENWLNGARVGRIEDGVTVYDELKPGFTEVALRRFYNAYDVTALLQEGANALSAVVSHGWWTDVCSGLKSFWNISDGYIAKLLLTYGDGTVETVGTDLTWKTECASAIRYADIFTGENYDARIDESWKLPGFDDAAWQSVIPNDRFHGEISAWKGSRITTRRDLERTAQDVTIYQGATGADETKYGVINVLRTAEDGCFTLQPGETVRIDFGQNFAGREAFCVEGAAGTTVTVTHGEMLNDREGLHSRGCDGAEGSVYNANYRKADATTIYTLNGKGVEEYSPLFTFYGFRYLEIVTDAPVTFHGVRGCVVTSVEKTTGLMETSDKDINQLINNIRWGQYSNYLSIPTDCPQRDERQGWTADTQVFTPAGCYLAFSKSFLTKFTCDMRDSQRKDGAIPGTAPTGAYQGADWGGTGWADAMVIIPWQLYRLYGDKSIIRENWAAMQHYVDGYLGNSDKYGPVNIWGDWLAYESNDNQIQEMLGVAFYAWDALMMEDMANAIGLADEAKKYRELYETEKAFFQQLYVQADGTLCRGEQSVCLYAQYLNLLPDAQSVAAVKKQLTDNFARTGNRLQTGFLGTAILLPALTKLGLTELAYSLLLQHENPSWLYSVDQGATTIWERWNSYTLKNGFGDVGMNSFNHYAYGVVAAWMFDSMAGIGCAKPGFKQVLLAPKPDRRLAVKASYDSAYGPITAESTFTADTWTYACATPANTTAIIRIPAASAEAVTVCGKAVSALNEADGIAFTGMENGDAVFAATNGSYVFETKLA